MTIMEAIGQRHSVRRFLEKPIHPAKAAQLEYVIEECNRNHGAHIQLVLEDGEVLAKQKAFSNAVNYIALVGRKKDKPQEALGYCGEMLALKAQAIGLNTCWIAGTYRRGKVKAHLNRGEKLYAIIAVGYGQDAGKPHKARPVKGRMDADEPIPEWFIRGVEAAMLAPTALHQQKFEFVLGETQGVSLVSRGFCKKLNAGILKFHFEIAAGTENFYWVK